MKMRKKKLLTRKKSSNPDWYNFFFKPLADPEFQAQVQWIVEDWSKRLRHYNEKWSPYAS